MNSEGCWSTVVCSADERRALGLASTSEWLLQCRLAAGHRGNHATDASTRPRADRRLWLEWNDVDSHAQSLIERNPCPVPSPDGARCIFFHGHGGPHFYARSNGHAPTAMSGQGRRPAEPARQPQPDAPRQDGYRSPTVGPPAAVQSHGPSTGDLTVVAAYSGSHRLDDPTPQTATPQTATPETPAPQVLSPVEPASEASPSPFLEVRYRGERRSTDFEPTSSVSPPRSRHRLDDDETVYLTADATGAQAGTPPAAPPAADALDGRPGPLEDPTVTAALRDIAAALEKLAAALDRR